MSDLMKFFMTIVGLALLMFLNSLHAKVKHETAIRKQSLHFGMPR